jgi:cyclophilin family peptidyl-prolyl cis-trans isomerase
MKISSISLMSSIAASLLLVGAGCGQGQVAIPASQVNNETALRSAGQINLAARSGQVAESAADDTYASQPTPTTPPTPAARPRPTSFPGVLPKDEIQGMQARLETTKGTIVFELLDGEAPKTVSNFVALTKSGYYDGLTFHRVVPGFVIQGGDPSGNGTGGPGYKFEDEPVTLDYDAGIVAMANAGPDTNGSQFFIVLEDQPTLPKNYTIFGRVTVGMDVVRKIKVGDRMTTVAIEKK